MAFKRLGLRLCTLLFPDQCALCRRVDGISCSLCVACAQQMRAVAPLQMNLTAARTIRIVAATAYEGPIVRLIRAKYHNDYLASYELARIIAGAYGALVMQYDLLVPVPMYWGRQLWRGFNHAERMANELSRLTGVPTGSVLERNRYTRLQQGLSATERVKNIHNAFVLSNGCKASVRSKRILIIDDVYTTGATIKQAARGLLPACPTKIDAMVAVRSL